MASSHRENGLLGLDDEDKLGPITDGVKPSKFIWLLTAVDPDEETGKDPCDRSWFMVGAAGFAAWKGFARDALPTTLPAKGFPPIPTIKIINHTSQSKHTPSIPHSSF